MVLRWAAAALLETEKRFRKIMGYKDLWMLKAVLDEETITPQQVRVAQPPNSGEPPQPSTADGTYSTGVWRPTWREVGSCGLRQDTTEPS
jgi:hypothetical protein